MGTVIACAVTAALSSMWMPTKRDLCRLAAREGAFSSACATSSKSGGAHLVAARLEGISGIEG